MEVLDWRRRLGGPVALPSGMQPLERENPRLTIWGKAGGIAHIFLGMKFSRPHAGTALKANYFCTCAEVIFCLFSGERDAGGILC